MDLSNREALLERISSGCHELDGPKAVGVSASLAQLDSPVRICLVGLGRAGAFHMQSLRFVGARVAQLVCVVDTNLELARRTATEFAASDCVARATLEEVMADVALAGRVDAIIIASTTDTHYGLCKLALSASKATFTEKPISHHAEEVRQSRTRKAGIRKTAAAAAAAVDTAAAAAAPPPRRHAASAAVRREQRSPRALLPAAGRRGHLPRQGGQGAAAGCSGEAERGGPGGNDTAANRCLSSSGTSGAATATFARRATAPLAAARSRPTPLREHSR